MRILLMVALAVGCSKSGTPAAASPEAVAKVEEIDGMRFVTAEALKPTAPPGVSPNVFAAVRLSSIRVLASEAKVAERVEADAMKAFVTAAMYKSLLTIGLNNQPIEVRVRFDFIGGRHQTRIEAAKGVLDPKAREYMQDGLDRIPTPVVKDALAMTMSFVVETPLHEQLMYSTFYPRGAAQVVDPNAKVKLTTIRLLTSEDDLAQHTKPEDLYAFTNAIHAHAERTIGASAKSIEVMVQVHCTPAGHTVKIAIKNAPDPKLLQALQDAVTAMPKLATTGDAAFQLYFVVAP